MQHLYEYTARLGDVKFSYIEVNQTEMARWLAQSPYHAVLAVKGCSRAPRAGVLPPCATPDCLRCGVLRLLRAIPPDQDRSTIMAQSNHSFESTLLVRDAQGEYRSATNDEVLNAARRVLSHRVRRGTTFEKMNGVYSYRAG